MTSAPRVLLARIGSVLHIELNRADVRNAVDARLAQELAGAVDQLDSEPEIRAGVISGGGGTFCSGLDLKAFAAGEPRPIVEGRGFAGIVEQPPEKPLVAAVEGAALAGGLEIALCADLIVAAEDAQLGVPEVSRGLVARGGGLLRLPRRIPVALAMELGLTGRPIDGRRAYEIGLVNRVTPPGEALAVALNLAHIIATNAPLAVRATKRIIRASTDLSEQEGWRYQREPAAEVFSSHDAREGALAFTERREPDWHGN